VGLFLYMSDLPDKVPLTTVLDKSPDEVSKSTPQAPTTGDGKVSYMDDIEYHRMSDFLDVGYEDRKDPHLANKLSFLTEWAQQAVKSQDRILVMERIKQLKTQLGLTDVGLPLIKKLYQWTRLDARRLSIEREQQLLSAES
jgi:hypothetical protein